MSMFNNISSGLNAIQQMSNKGIDEISKAGRHVVSQLKEACTNILDKLGFSKAKSLSNTQTSSPELRIVTMVSDDGKRVGFDAASINIKNIKESLQEGLIKERTTKGIDAWANAVVVNLKNNSSTFDQMFSRKDGVFNIDKLSSEELSALKSKALD